MLIIYILSGKKSFQDHLLSVLLIRLVKMIMLLKQTNKQTNKQTKQDKTKQNKTKQNKNKIKKAKQNKQTKTS